MTTFFTSVPPWIQDAKQEEEVGWKLVPRPRGREAESQVKYQCEISGTPFSNGEKLRPHSLPHPEQKPYSCPQLHCGKAFASKYKLYRHMVTHSAQKPHQCTYCDKMFHRKDHLHNHLQTHDPNKEALHCSECEHLKAHLRWVAGGAKEKKHPCDHCDPRFYTRKDVWRHLVVHTGRKDFLCQYCAQWFGRKDHLTCHVKKSHSQELLKIKTAPVDMLGLLSCNSTVSVKEELSPVLCMASQDMMGAKAFPGMLPMGMYGTHIPNMPTTGMPHSLVHNTLAMDEALLTKSPANLSEALCAANVDFSHLLGFLPLNLPPCNLPGATGSLVMGYSQAEAQPLLTTLQAQPQDSPGSGGPLNFGPLHSLPPVFTSGLSTTTLPHFHQAFQ
ncbi:Zinc finger protein PLAGL2 [Heterocephalus glaber]|uniref:Zinc finger protein PLAGL2 n=1 Tax=Heterocephalus glaber TaxID=10181 RepID=G5AS80_HETGA|nr:Zinc finger protein PLAGL2 [Heterocephalus glaber]